MRLMSATPTRIELRIAVARPDLLVEILAGHRRDVRARCALICAATISGSTPGVRIDDHGGRELFAVRPGTIGGRVFTKHLLGSGQRHAAPPDRARSGSAP